MSRRAGRVFEPHKLQKDCQRDQRNDDYDDEDRDDGSDEQAEEKADADKVAEQAEERMHVQKSQSFQSGANKCAKTDAQHPNK